MSYSLITGVVHAWKTFTAKTRSLPTDAGSPTSCASSDCTPTARSPAVDAFLFFPRKPHAQSRPVPCPNAWRKPPFPAGPEAPDALPAVAAGMFSRTRTSALSPRFSVTVDGETETEWGEFSEVVGLAVLAPWITEAANVCVEDPRFLTRRCCSPEKSRENSATPKLRLPDSLVPRATTDVRVAAKGCTRPEPPSLGWNPTSCDASAVLAMARRTSSGSQVGCDCRASAATPLTCGVAIEVPERRTPRLPLPIAVERMLTPGAVTSGLRKLSRLRGPPEVNPAKRRNPGFGTVLAARVRLVAAIRICASALSAPCGLPRTPRNGMVTSLPLTGSEMSPSKTPKVGSLLISTTAAAPCRKPNTARSTRAQTPRSATTTLPVIFAGSYSFSSQPRDTPSEPVVAVSGSTTMDSEPPGSVALLLFCAFSGPPLFSVRVAPGKVAVESIAAAASVLSAAAGDPVK